VNYVSFFDAVRSPHAASGMLVCFRGRFAGLGRNSGQSNRKTNDSSRTACRQQLNPFFPKPQQRCFARRRFAGAIRFARVMAVYQIDRAE
jgi:hypothetical protein